MPGDHTLMPRLTVSLSDLKCRTAKNRECAYKLLDAGDIHLFAKHNGMRA